MHAGQYHWQRVRQVLQDEIESDSLPDGGRVPTIQGVCRRFQVSAITARRAFDELERAGLITRKRFVGASICRKASKRPMLPVTVVAPNWVDGHDAQPGWPRVEIQRGIMDAAKNCDVRIRMMAAAMLPADMQNENLLLTTDGPGGNTATRILCQRNCLVRAYCPPPLPGVASVRLDIRKGAELAVRHLVELGHRRIALVLHQIANPWQWGRFDGYARVLKRSRITWDWELVCETVDLSPDRIQGVLKRVLELAQPPTAFFCGNDLIAVMVMRHCREHGILAPGDISVVGFDNTPECANTTPPLTSVDPQLYKLGRTALETLAARARAGKKCAAEDILIPPKLVVRGSTAKFR